MTKPLFHDITVGLRDEYTALVNRVEGERLHSRLLQKLGLVEESGVLLLDFSIVTSIDASFLDELLVPVLRGLCKGEYGERYLVGVNVDRNKINIEGLNDLMLHHGLLFLAYDKAGEIIILGSAASSVEQALKYVQRTEKQTSRQLALQMNISDGSAQSFLDLLLKNRLIRAAFAAGYDIHYYEPVIPTADLPTVINQPISDEIVQRIAAVGAMESSTHYELPSGLHAAEFLHFSRVMEDARFTTKIATFLGEAFRELTFDIVLTVKSPNNLVLAQLLGEYLDAAVVAAVPDGNEGRLNLPSTDQLRAEDRVLIVIDVIASGWIVNRLIRLVRDANAALLGIGVIVDIFGNRATFMPVPVVRLASLNLRIHQPNDCPLCKEYIPVVPLRLLQRG